MPVHRYVFEKFKGPIPHGYDVDHMCARWSCDVVAVRKCVNPDHLQAVPPILNQQLKMLRRMGYGTYDMDLDDAPLERPLPEDSRALAGARRARGRFLLVICSNRRRAHVLRHLRPYRKQ
ncbi:Uncharacterised protein [Afipia felis]|uniref:HNH nuclease domain-containing protein n=2 Tax=Afipia felis TaxID=1035 RepID=A0A381AYP0_AFIFE|nr:Uncharacterised protein [Afipia felis]